MIDLSKIKNVALAASIIGGALVSAAHADGISISPDFVDPPAKSVGATDLVEAHSARVIEPHRTQQIFGTKGSEAFSSLASSADRADFSDIAKSLPRTPDMVILKEEISSKREALEAAIAALNKVERTMEKTMLGKSGRHIDKLLEDVTMYNDALDEAAVSGQYHFSAAEKYAVDDRLWDTGEGFRGGATYNDVTFEDGSMSGGGWKR